MRRILAFLSAVVATIAIGIPAQAQELGPLGGLPRPNVAIPFVQSGSPCFETARVSVAGLINQSVIAGLPGAAGYNIGICSFTVASNQAEHQADLYETFGTCASGTAIWSTEVSNTFATGFASNPPWMYIIGGYTVCYNNHAASGADIVSLTYFQCPTVAPSTNLC